MSCVLYIGFWCRSSVAGRWPLDKYCLRLNGAPLVVLLKKREAKWFPLSIETIGAENGISYEFKNA